LRRILEEFGEKPLSSIEENTRCVVECEESGNEKKKW
jgi:hypothetical protein